MPTRKTVSRIKPNLEFQIQQLRLDKLIFSVEAILVCFAVFLLLMFFPVFYRFFPAIPDVVPVIILVAAILATIYALATNLWRWRKIIKLEKELTR